MFLLAEFTTKAYVFAVSHCNQIIEVIFNFLLKLIWKLRRKFNVYVSRGLQVISSEHIQSGNPTDALHQDYWRYPHFWHVLVIPFDVYSTKKIKKKLHSQTLSWFLTEKSNLINLQYYISHKYYWQLFRVGFEHKLNIIEKPSACGYI